MTAIFNFNGTDLRTIEIEGAPWFVAADVCRCLGLTLGASGVSNHMKKVGKDERRVLAKSHPLLTQQLREFRFEGRENWLTFTSESGLYKLIMRSDKDAARPFQDWVTKVVLPSIRKTGGYQASAEQPLDPLMQGLSQFLAGLLEQVQAPLLARLEQQDAVIISLKDHIEKLASREVPEDYWFDRPVSSMDNGHIANAIKWAKKQGYDYSALLRERNRRASRQRAA